ncbi:DNA polymerase III subunit psi [Thalassotalea agarivorans]|uniref:DNA polymerase III psi subunit n=1 Tax=Thalassotalea agarivorans TaxID=349064 RepID=A0A1I0AKG0_THASX|nr:DNA polymerase III subunit psi [Thalassotalea agarivorans]SES93792.1 DNA polymerase III psi subunit [Thalassotalea agarivorans]
MHLNHRQFAIIKESGATVWQTKDSAAATQTDSLAIDFDLLKTSSLFQDILTALNLSIGEVTLADNTLHCGMFNWQFTPSEAVSFDQSTLITPPLEQLSQQAQLKRSLWQIITKHQLIQTQ